jgi:hypothetical protein
LCIKNQTGYNYALSVIINIMIEYKKILGEDAPPDLPPPPPEIPPIV